MRAVGAEPLHRLAPQRPPHLDLDRAALDRRGAALRPRRIAAIATGQNELNSRGTPRRAAEHTAGRREPRRAVATWIALSVGASVHGPSTGAQTTRRILRTKSRSMSTSPFSIVIGERTFPAQVIAGNKVVGLYWASVLTPTTRGDPIQHGTAEANRDRAPARRQLLDPDRTAASTASGQPSLVRHQREERSPP